VSDSNLDRRQFIGTCVATAAGISSLSCAGDRSPPQQPFDAKGLPTRVLGKTGVVVPIIAFGAGSRFCSVTDVEESLGLLEHALANGIFHWDTGHDYVYEGVVSEERLGMILETRREQVFLATKVGDRTYDGAMRHVEESLQRLKTDHIDLYQIHNVRSLDDVDAIGTEGGVIEAMHQLKEQGVARFIGFTGHSSAEALAEMVRRFDFDTMLYALNHQTEDEDREGFSMAEAAAKNMGILAMKVIRPRETDESLSPRELVHYALSLDNVAAAVIGTDSVDVVDQNVDLMKTFERLSPDEMQRIGRKLQTVCDGGRLAWMQPGYTDGTLA